MREARRRARDAREGNACIVTVLVNRLREEVGVEGISERWEVFKRIWKRATHAADLDRECS